MVQQMQQEKLGRRDEGDTDTTTTGINISIHQGDMMCVVQSSITVVSASWLEQMAQVGKEHSKEMQMAQLRHTQELLEQTKEKEKQFQVVQWWEL